MEKLMTFYVKDKQYVYYSLKSGGLFVVGNDTHYNIECRNDYRMFICTALVLISLASNQARDSLLLYFCINLV